MKRCNQLLFCVLAGCAVFGGIAAEAVEMDGGSARFRLELYYQASVPAADTKPVSSEVTVAEGANLYLEDKAHEHPNLPHYNFRVSKISAEAITLEQIPDRRGNIQRFYTGSAAAVRLFRLEPGKPFRISLNVPGGGPVWTITWMGPEANAKAR